MRTTASPSGMRSTASRRTRPPASRAASIAIRTGTSSGSRPSEASVLRALAATRSGSAPGLHITQRTSPSSSTRTRVTSSRVSRFERRTWRALAGVTLLGSTVLESCLVPERAAGGECRGRARPIKNIPEPGRVVNSKGAGHRAASPGDGSGPGQGQNFSSAAMPPRSASAGAGTNWMGTSRSSASRTAASTRSTPSRRGPAQYGHSPAAAR